MRIHAIQTGRVSIRQNQVRGVGHGVLRQVRPLLGGPWTEPLPVLCWAIEHPEGVVLVDTGELAAAAGPGYFPWWHPYFRFANRFEIGPEDEVGPQLERAGLSAGDVRRVVLTHLHTDHAGGLGYFPKAEVVIHRPEYEAALKPSGRVLGYLPGHWPSWLKPRLMDFDGAAVLGGLPSVPVTDAGDVLMVSTPGHTDGHMSVVVLDGDRPVFLAGDVSYNEGAMLDGAVDGVSAHEDVARRTLAAVKEYVTSAGATYLPTHDPGSVARLAGE